MSVDLKQSCTCQTVRDLEAELRVAMEVAWSAARKLARVRLAPPEPQGAQDDIPDATNHPDDEQEH